MLACLFTLNAHITHVCKYIHEYKSRSCKEGCGVNWLENGVVFCEVWKKRTQNGVAHRHLTINEMNRPTTALADMLAVGQVSNIWKPPKIQQS